MSSRNSGSTQDASPMVVHYIPASGIPSKFRKMIMWKKKNLLQMDSITCFSGNERELISGLDWIFASSASPVTAEFFCRSWSLWHLRVFDPSLWGPTAATTYIPFAQVGPSCGWESPKAR